MSQLPVHNLQLRLTGRQDRMDEAQKNLGMRVAQIMKEQNEARRSRRQLRQEVERWGNILLSGLATLRMRT